MYDLKKLNIEKMFKHKSEEILLDSLTGTLNRRFIIKYINELIDKKESFAFAIIDIDNFKNVNDTYGHQVGDVILKELGEKLTSLDINGYLGRYGGDEFILVLKGVKEYDDAWHKIRDINSKIFRKYYTVGSKKIFLTGTFGCVRYPVDATSYDGLFSKMDKCLYRGKEKGRNCFIIYVESLHGSIDTNNVQMRIQPIDAMNKIYHIFFENETLETKLQETYKFFNEYYKVETIGFVPTISSLKKLSKNINMKPTDVDRGLKRQLDVHPVISFTDSSELKDLNPLLFKYCKSNEVKSLVISKVFANDNDYGYLVIQCNNHKRIWQNEELAIFLHFTHILGLTIERDSISKYI